MDYLKSFLNTNAVIDSYGRGQILLKARLGLHIVNIEEREFGQDQVDRKRELPKITSQNKVVCAPEVQNKLDMLSAERFTQRLNSQVGATGTIYGSQQKVGCIGKQHSYFGMNKKYLTTDGLPNETMIMKRLRELNISNEVKEYRIGRLFNAIFTNDFYDNATPLLYVLYMQAQLYKFWSKNETIQHTVIIPYEEANFIINGSEGNNKTRFKTFMNRNKTGVGFGDNDECIGSFLETLEHWFDGVTGEIQKMNNTEERNKFIGKTSYSWNVKVWQMYEYDDGHSKSGNKFGDVCDFINNKFIKPMHMFTYKSRYQQFIVQQEYNTPDMSENSYVAYGKYRYYLNCSSLTARETSILNKYLAGSFRQTPFLADQNVKLLTEEDRVLSTGSINYINENFEYSGEEIHTLLLKLVTTHRYHEDFLAATRAAKYWLAQPATETVESHWWLHVKRRLLLPKLGLKRAALHFMIQDEGVCTSQMAIDNVANLKCTEDGAIVESLFLNTCWYWGEFMLTHNKETQAKLQQALKQRTILNVDERYRADVIVSTMLGCKIPLPIHNIIRTEWDVLPEELYKLHVPFGKIGFSSIADYGYELNGNKYILNTLVTPGATALITGLAGTLMEGTPYSSTFTSKPAFKIVEDDRRKLAHMYNDLWALGTYTRWQGYNLKYAYPMTDHRHVTFAANGVGIAMPPVTPKMRRSLAYIIEGLQQRESCWSSDLTFLFRCETTYSWNKTKFTVQSEPDWNAIESSDLSHVDNIITGFKGYVEESDKYVAAIVGQYDIVTSGFQVAMIKSAVILDPNTDSLPLLDVNIDDPGGTTELGQENSE